MPHAAPRRPMALAALTLAVALAPSCGQVRTVTGDEPAPSCRIVPGPSPRQCPLMGSDADWLPPAYVRNATCRCQSTPNSPSANCVRGRLETILRDVPRSTREAWREKKRTLLDAGRVEEYQRWLVEHAGKRIYLWHRKAHARCCCPNALPPYPEWSTVVTTPFASCSSRTTLERFGGCRGPRGSW